MNRARRLLAAILSLALAQFGVFATAPAHAHTHDHAAGHAFHSVELDVEAERDHGGPHDHEGDATPDAEAPAGEGNAPGSGAERVTHVHSCPLLAPADALLGFSAPPEGDLLKPALLAARAVARAPTPPLRPPRAL